MSWPRTVGTHEDDCIRFPTGWLCTATCPAVVVTATETDPPQHETTSAPNEESTL